MRPARHLLYAFFILLLAWHSGAAQSGADTLLPSSLVWFPSQRIFPRMVADGISHQFGVSKDLSSAMIHGSIGGLVPVLDVNFEMTTCQIGAGATVLTSFIKRPRLLQMETVDFLLEFPVDIRLTERLALRTGYGHFSAHFADDGIEILGRSSVNYAKDYLLLLGAWRILAVDGVLYAGGHWNFHSLPEEGSRWTMQWGVETGNLLIFPEVFLYAALDLRWKSEAAWAATGSYQCGLRLLPREERALRIAYTYRTGPDDRGQFYQQRADVHLVGVYLDF